MSTVASELTQNAQEQTLNAIKQSQQAVVEAVRAWAQAVEKSVPETPTLPFASELPTLQQLLQTSFEFAEQLLKAQREFAENLVSAAGPVLDKSQPKES
jgi:hypothetical protein